jgi:hypothetical protein
MLKHKNISCHSGKISVPKNYEIDKIWTFIDTNISGFVLYFQSVKDSNKENRTSEFLIHYFYRCMSEQLQGFLPYYFVKNPTQQQSCRETDIGVFFNTSEKPITLIEFEAKILSSENFHNKEYVCGERGGIERFKRGDHASHLSVCGMFGYVQSKNTDHWVNKINRWIKDLADKNADATIHWSDNEILTKTDLFPDVGKYLSSHSRLSLNEITIHHYFIEL